jgi:hypothetical protein
VARIVANGTRSDRRLPLDTGSGRRRTSGP